MTQVRPLYLPPIYQEAADYGRLILRDGSTATIRVSQPSDFPQLMAFFERLSPEARLMRFFSPGAPPSDYVQSMCDSSNPRTQLALLVFRLIDGKPSIIAAASYHVREGKPNAKPAEVAFAVDDSFQGKGIGTLLLERLAVIAARFGITKFWAVTRSDNWQMIEVFRRSGFDVHTRWDGGEIVVEFSVVPSEESVAQFEMRDRVATITSLRHFFHPHSVTVIGASRDPKSIGHRVVENLVLNHFQGVVYPVNPNASVVCSIHAYQTVQALPETPDLAVVVVPIERLLGVIDECGAVGIKTLVIVTGGFAERRDEGKALEREILEKARGYGMRILGPNCLGLLNTDPEIQLNGTLSPRVLPGRVAMASQSGPLGLAVLDFARQRSLGLSSFASLGNKIDVSSNDLLQYWEEDSRTNVILLYLESFGNPRRFARLARRVSRVKPIVAVMSGRMRADREIAVEALFQQTGVIRAESLDEMLDLAAAMTCQPLPRGRRVSILSNSSGAGFLCANVCQDEGLIIPDLADKTQQELAVRMPESATLTNPVDLTLAADGDVYCQAVETMLAADDADVVVVIYVKVGLSDPADVSRGIAEGVARARAAGSNKPVLACVMTEEVSCLPEASGERVPLYRTPETVGRVLAKVVGYAEWQAESPGVVLDFSDSRVDEARAVCRQALAQAATDGGDASDGVWLTTAQTRTVLAAMGLPMLPGEVVRTAEEAARVAEEIGFPVAAKVASPTVQHKTEYGGVQLNLANKAAVKKAARLMHERFQAEHPEGLEGVLVQPMVQQGVEVMVRVTQDPFFGPVMTFGLSGMHIELLGDLSFGVTPLTDRDARMMIRQIRGYRLLEGYRGLPPADVEALEKVLLRLSRLVDEAPEIDVVNLNPIFAMPQGHGCRIIDARICVRPVTRGAPGTVSLAGKDRAGKDGAGKEGGGKEAAGAGG